MTLGLTYGLGVGLRNFFRFRTIRLKQGRLQLSCNEWPACVATTCRKTHGALQWLLPAANAFQAQGIRDS